jgi:hypothetical protein
MEVIKRLLRGTSCPDLEKARVEDRDALNALQRKLQEAKDKGLTVSLSKEALERITKIEPSR